nr:DUF6311 domain-containing protein [Caldovatus aquaticus]
MRAQGRAPDREAGQAAAATRRIAALLAVAGGALAAIATLGPRVLDIRDLGWLLHGTLGPDPVSYLLAWTYFAASPWSWPPGLNPGYGLELSSALFYADALPLLAFAAKALRPLLDIPQYWGPWLALSAALQAGFAWRLLGLAVADPVARALGAVLFAWQPMLLNRMGGHFALAAQWALLWALWLCLRDPPRRQTLHWAACLGTVAMLNAYILAMGAGLWAADWLARLLRARGEGGIGAGRLAVQAAVVPAVAAAALWAAGFFTIAGRLVPVGPGYAETQLDLTAPFDAVEWGRLLPALPGLRHWEHGGSYLGAGTLLLLAVAAGLLGRGRPRAALRRHAVLVAALAAMLAFAVSHRVAVAGHVVVLFELPEPARPLADLLRASERFFWPLAYAAIFAAIALVAGRLPRRSARLLLAAVLALQIADIEAGMARVRALVAAAPPATAERLADPFWEEAARRYLRVRAVPAGNFGPHWEEIARFAARHGLPTDAVYLARVDPDAVAALNARVLGDLAAGRWEGGTLYVLRDAATWTLVAARADPTRDLLAIVDGVSVFAPGWHAP